MKYRLLNDYKILENEITSLIRTKKQNYYSSYFTNNKMNLQKTWQGIKEIINLNSKNYNHPNIIKSDNGIITNEKNVSSSFIKYFSSVAEKILRKYEGRKSHLDYLSRPLINSFVIRECDHLEVEYTNIIITD